MFMFYLARCCDEGKSFLVEIPNSPAAMAYTSIIHSKLDTCTCMHTYIPKAWFTRMYKDRLGFYSYVASSTSKQLDLNNHFLVCSINLFL